MVTDHNINIGLELILDFVATLRMITQQNVISNWYNQFLTCSVALIMLSRLIYEFEGLLIACIIALSCWFNQTVLDLKLSGL